MKFVTDSLPVNDILKKNVLVSCDHGLMIVNRFDCNQNKDGQGQWILDHGNVGTVEAHLTFENIKIADPVILDVGANIGTYATWIAKAYPKAKIYCFEPQRIVFQMLCGNLAINNIENVYAYNYAFGNKNSIIEFNEPDYGSLNNFGSFSLIQKSVNTTANKYQVDLYTLDNFVKKYNLSQVDFIKIDCEGMDLQILEGALNVIKEFKPNILIEYKTDWSDLKDDIIVFLNQFKYEYLIEDRNILAR